MHNCTQMCLYPHPILACLLVPVCLRVLQSAKAKELWMEVITSDPVGPGLYEWAEVGACAA